MNNNRSHASANAGRAVALWVWWKADCGEAVIENNRVLRLAFDHYLIEKKEKSDYCSFHCLAEMLYELQRVNDFSKQQYKWAPLLKEEAESLDKSAVYASYVADLQQLQGILEVPGEYLDDEVLLIMTLHDSVMLSSSFVDWLGWAGIEELDEMSLEAILQLKKDKRTSQACMIALRVIGREW